MHSFSAIFALVLAAPAAFAAPLQLQLQTSINDAPVAVNTVSGDFAQVGAAFQDLRAIRGFFEGGEWNDLVDPTNSPKHRLMLSLEQSFLPTSSFEDFSTAMGAPDAILSYLDPAVSEEEIGSWMKTAVKAHGGPARIGALCSVQAKRSEEGVSHYRSEESVSHLYRSEEGVSHYRSEEGVSHLRSEEGVSHYRSEEGVSHLRSEEGVSHRRVEEGVVHATCGSTFFAIYLWRGWHDYMWVYVNRGEVEQTGWYNALE
ncbi:hypothetical protein BDK51DRAFT_32266 [Blyttiomyces helicus]|uniref:Uncharacterized protein n=1 Tax=Blyttiomyces helicus TaxID=388810 RepID=A0A4P9W340_9FUNG|nr:hypothetical protein BDK51DRAFT_32266 [Blyttiomyces helicus]|eukprot:RKO85623.1 hypothetical protein BDK51DRAFT_32266 [Blyttiomyces helicus]